MLFKRLPLLVIALLFLSIAAPLRAHDLPLGTSRWAFGNNTITACIDFKPLLFAELKAIKEGHYDVHAISDEQLRQIATDIMQPYVNKRLSIIVNGKTYPIKVSKLTKTPLNLYTAWLSVDNVSFSKPENEVKIAYSVLFEETSNEHMNLAFAYVTDAKGDALQREFDLAHPDFQTTFDANNQVWELSIAGSPGVAAAENKAATPVARDHAGDDKKPTGKPASKDTVHKSIADGKKALLSIGKDGAGGQLVETKPTSSSAPTLSEKAPNTTVTDPSLQRASRETPRATAWTTIRQFVPLGIEHILTGYDHIAFLLAVIVIGLSIPEVLKVITAFTIAHSITLLLAALQIITINSRFVESVIAFSICYVAVENIFKRKVNYRWLITFGFGLIHGFGFASALQELIVRKASLLLSVVSFNAGVEIGQLMVFFVMLPILYLLNKFVAFRTVTVSTSIAIFALAFTWLIERVFQLKLLWF